MYDNLNSNYKPQEINEGKKSSDKIIKDLMLDYEEQLYTIRVQLKAYVCQLEQKEQEIIEKEQKKDNRNLFSPNHIDDSRELLNKIDDLKSKIVELKQREQQLSDIVYGLNMATQCIGNYASEEADKDNKNYIDSYVMHFVSSS